MNYLKFEQWLMVKKSQLYTRLIRKEFGFMGRCVMITPPFRSDNPGNIRLGDSCRINAGSWLDTIPEYGTATYSPRLEIGDHTYIGYNAHIMACGDMKIGSNVVIADKVYISDNQHGFQDVTRPIMPQPLTHPGPVIIEDEVWLGEGVCVMPNVKIGKHSVIGANSVVTKDIPPYSVAVGVPAKIIKRYNFETEQWEKA